MFNATRALVAVLIFAVGAGLTLVAVPADRSSDRAVAPAVEAPTADDLARFTFHAYESSSPPGGTVTRTAFGERFEDQSMGYFTESSDARMRGDMTTTFNGHFFDSADVQYPASVLTGTWVIENEAGAWVGPFTAIDYIGTPDFQVQSILSGTGAYDGLSAIITNGEGLIFPGDMPESP